MTPAIVAQNLSKQYQLGQLHREDLFSQVVLQWFRKRSAQRERKSQESVWAVRDISMRVDEGEVVGIIGRNGAGKSTLLKILSRITYPTSGKLDIRGRVAALLEVGTGFHGELTGRENIFLNGSILGMKHKEVAKKLDAIVDFAGVEKFLDTPVKRYSSGMFLRLGFAVAAHLEPHVLIVDEVLAVGDVGFQKKCLNVMSELRRGGRTVLFVSHNMSAVENLCSRVLWIDNGQVRENGPAKQVIESYMATFAETTQVSVDLRGVTNRLGTGDVRFTRVEFLSSEGSPLRIVRSGDPITLRLSYRAENIIPAPAFEVSITTDTGMLITKFSTLVDYEISSLPPGEGYIDLHIPCFAFQPGRYFLSLSLQTSGPIYYDALDYCLQYEVETSNYFQTGRGISSNFGVVFLPWRWNLQPLYSLDPQLNGKNSELHEEAP
ncbi:MAG: ABC transporter ATP-binding protein [Candidatus Binatia bacterium]